MLFVLILKRQNTFLILKERLCLIFDVTLKNNGCFLKISLKINRKYINKEEFWWCKIGIRIVSSVLKRQFHYIVFVIIHRSKTV